MDCNPQDHFDVRTQKLNTELAYTYFQNVSQETSEDLRRDASLNIMFEDIPIGFTFDDAAKVASAFRSKTGATLNQRESLTIFERYLTGNGLKQYEACIRGLSPLTVKVHDLIGEWETVTFEVNWSVKSSTAEGDLLIEIEGGRLADGTQSAAFPNFTNGNNKILRVTRDSQATISLKASIDGQEAIREVSTKPKISRPVVAQRVVELVGLIRGGYWGHDVVQGDVQIAAEAGTVLLFNTASMDLYKSYGRPDSVPADLTADIIEKSPHRIVFRTRNQHGWNPGVSVIQGKSYVWQLTL